MKQEIKKLEKEKAPPKVEREVLELLEKYENLREENKRLKAEILEYQKNGVSGLRRREVFYKSLESGIQENAPEFVKNIELFGDEFLKERVKLWNLNKIENVKLSILMGDMAYLSLANKGGRHAEGDRLLQHIGEITKEELGSPEIGKSEKEARFVAYRHGGDEFTGIIRDNLKNAEKIAEEFELKVGKSKVDVLEQYGLKPRIDIGTAHLSEGLEAFKELIEAGVEIPGGDRMRKIKNLLVDIADQRSALNKAKTRLPLLTELKSKKPEIYQEVKNELRKGALDATDEEIDFLIEHNEVEKFINGKLEEKIKKGKENIELEKSIVEKIARRKK